MEDRFLRARKAALACNAFLNVPALSAAVLPASCWRFWRFLRVRVTPLTELNLSGLPTQSPALQCRCRINCRRSPVGNWSGRGDSGTNHRSGHRCNASVRRGAVRGRTRQSGQSWVDRIQWYSTRRKELCCCLTVDHGRSASSHAADSLRQCHGDCAIRQGHPPKNSHLRCLRSNGWNARTLSSLDRVNRSLPLHCSDPERCSLKPRFGL